MEFWKTIGSLARRIYVGPPVIMVAIAAAALASFLVPLQYQSHSFVVLATPTSGGTLSQDPDQPGGRTNPLLQFNDSLRTTATVLIQSMNTRDAARDLGVVRDGPTEVVINDGRTNPDLLGSNGPFIYIEGTSTSAREARAVVVRTQERVRDELLRRQIALDAPRSTFITVATVIPTTDPEPVLAAKLEMGGVVLVGMIVLGFLLAYLVERLRLARRSSRAAGADADQDDEVDPTLKIRVSHGPMNGNGNHPQFGRPVTVER